MKIRQSYFYLSVFAAVAGIATAQNPTYTAAQIISPFGSGYANSSYNGSAVVMNPAFGLQTAIFFPQDGLQFTSTWDGNSYGTEFFVNRFFIPGPILSNRTLIYFGAAWGACSGQVVGYSVLSPPGAFNGSGGAATFQTPWHATVWDPAGASGVDLHNANNNSRALACDGGRQAGEADNGQDFSGTYNKTFGSQHAVLWSGTAKSEIDLHSGPFSDSQANGISGAIQVGWGGNTKEVQFASGGGIFTVKQLIKHAVMWMGTPSSIKDLHPAGYEESSLMAIGLLNANGIKVGWARPLPPGVPPGTPLTAFQQFGMKHAMVWTATGVIDLHQFLPPDFVTSYALGVDPITQQIVGGAQRATDPQPTPYVWTLNQ